MSAESDSAPPARTVSARPLTTGGTISCAATWRADTASRATSSANETSSGRRRASASDAGWYGSPVRWNANTLSVPSSRKSSATWLRRFASTVATRTTVTIPITMPMMASTDRDGLERTDSTARRKDSRLAARQGDEARFMR